MAKMHEYVKKEANQMQKSRWYQLSTLQILVAMAVVAVFLNLNISESKGPAEFGEIISYIDLGDFYEVEYSKGWPFVYSTRRVFDPNEKVLKMTANERIGSMADSILKSEKKRTNRSALVGNAIACVCAIICSLFLVGVKGKIFGTLGWK